MTCHLKEIPQNTEENEGKKKLFTHMNRRINDYIFPTYERKG
jgi:hypothetical protein